MPLADFLPGIFVGSGPGPFDIERPGEYTIKDFMDEGASGGIDALTTTTATMNHNGDTITLKNPYDGVTAHFEIKTVKVVSELELTGWKRKEAKTFIDELTLTTGQTWVKTLSEGTNYEPETGFLPEKINRDIHITLVSYDTPKGTKYTGTGRQMFGPGGHWNPENIIDRVRSRRMFIGPLGRWPGSSGFSDLAGDVEDREKVIDLIKQGKVTNPLQGAMIRSAYAYDDAKRFKKELPLRPY